MINPLGIAVTVALFKFSQKLKISLLSPILIAGAAIILLLKLFHINYAEYKQTVSFLTFLLAPATISLGYPLYKNLNLLVRNKRVIYTAFVFAVVIAILSTNFIGNVCHAEHSLVISMLPKSVTAPIAIEVSKSLHGIPGLSIGAASHVLGTSKCIETGKPKQVVMSTLALVVVGILTVIIAPVLVRLIY